MTICVKTSSKTQIDLQELGHAARRLRVARVSQLPGPALRIAHPNTCTDDDDDDDDVHDDRMTSALACAEGTARVASALGADAGRKEEGRSRACAWEEDRG